MSKKRRTMKDVDHTPPDGVSAAGAYRRGVKRNEKADDETEDRTDD